MLCEGDAIAREIQAVLAGRAGGLDVVGGGRTDEQLAQHVAQVRKAGEAFQQALRALSFFTGVLKDARYARTAQGLCQLGPLGRDGDGANHAHFFAQVLEFVVGGTSRVESGQNRTIRCGSRRKSIGVEDETLAMQFEAMLELDSGRLEDFQRGVPRPHDHRVFGDQQRILSRWRFFCGFVSRGTVDCTRRESGRRGREKTAAIEVIATIGRFGHDATASL